MKKIIFALLLLAPFVWAQETEVVVNPDLSPATLANMVLTTGRDTISVAAKTFTTVIVGDYVYGPGVKGGTTVLWKSANDSLIKISDTAYVTGTVSLEFSYASSAAASTGEWLSMPFPIYNNTSNGVVELKSVELVDKADIVDSVDILLFNALGDSTGLYSATVAVKPSDVNNILGYVSLVTKQDLGTLRIMYNTTDPFLALPKGGKVWGRLICRKLSTITPLTTHDFTLRFRFKE